MPKVTAIIPIYNVEAYLSQCLDSVLSQSLEDIEIVCVNDGSTDTSLTIVEEYAAKDRRIVIIDKENGGYGKAVNCGLDRAQGEYIAIIEPDDFIDPAMFEDLYRFAHRERDGVHSPIDVVKGSYWEYYDSGEDGSDTPLLSRPTLSYSMPASVESFSLDQSQDVICNHPSIWSALYRRDFLEAEGIRFVEPKGAGWADNPFLFQTLVLARTICWVPKAYYYYRQTNVSASSFLKDFHIPFDRLKDIEGFLGTRSPGPDIMAAFYKRELDYISDVVTTFGFSDANPEVRAEIMHVIDSMDPAIVLSHPRLGSHYAQLYLRYAEPLKVNAHDRAEEPLLSIVLPVQGDDRSALMDTISALNEIKTVFFECICVGYGEGGSAVSCCKQAAAHDCRFAVIEDANSFAAAINAGLSIAQGKFAICMNPGDILFEEILVQALLIAEKHQIDACFCMPEGVRTNDLARDVALDQSFTLPGLDDNPHSDDAKADKIASKLLVYAVTDEVQKSKLLSSASFSLCDRLFSLSLVRESAISFDEHDSLAGLAFTASLLKHALKSAFCLCPLGGKNEKATKAIRAFPEPLIQSTATQAFHTAAVLRAQDVIASKRTDRAWDNAWKSLLLVAFITDINDAISEEIASLCFETHFEEVCREVLLGEQGVPSMYQDVEAYNSLVYLKRFGFSRYNYRLYCLEANRCYALETELREMHKSYAFRIGSKMVSLAKKAIPSNLVSKARAR